MPSLKDDTLDEEVYKATQVMLLNMAAIVRGMPLAQFINTISVAETTGPMLDPTLWRDAHGKMDEIKEMARGLLSFQNSLPKMCPQCKEKTVAYRGAKYCGAGCSARAEAHEPPAPDAG
jgi:hypothetical protein